jgi:hypothetical protein
LGNVRDETQGLVSLRPQLAGGSDHLLLTASTEDHTRSFGGKARNNGAAQATTSSSDECDLSLYA